MALQSKTRRLGIAVLLFATTLATGCAPRVRVVEVEVTVAPQISVIEVTATAMPTSAPATVTVCANGCDFVTIQAAVDDIGTIAGFTINVTDAIHTEAGITVNKDVIIQGEGTDSTIVQAHDMLDGAPDRVFFITNGAAVTIRGMTIRHGNPPVHPQSGGGIYNDDFCILTLEDSVITKNVASDGAGIYNKGAVVLTNCTISDNVADGIEDPGHECGNGGGIKNVGDGTVMLTNCTISGNSAVGNGGGIKGNCGGTVEVVNSTISDNSAVFRGGGVFVMGTVTIVNSTIADNSAEGIGRDTAISNAGGGVWIAGTLSFTNTIIANNTTRVSTGGDCAIGSEGTIDANANNLIGDDSCGPDYSGNPLLGPLADNGADTQTHALLPGSPVIDVIPADECVVDTDQRGVSRPQGMACDIGAYEMQ